MHETTFDAAGRATWTFRGAEGVERCVAVIAATARGEARTTSVMVAPPPAAARIDGVTAIAAVLIASFAIDRIAHGTLFLLSFWRRWRAAVSDPDDPGATHDGRKRYRLAYFCVAGALGLGALGWYGQVRILAALGFPGVEPRLDTVITGLLLVGGAERTGALLKGMSPVGDAAAGSSPPPPIEITGTLMLDDRARRGEGGEPGVRARGPFELT